MATTITLRLDDDAEIALEELKQYFFERTASKACIAAIKQYKGRDVRLHEEIDKYRRLVDKYNELVSYLKMMKDLEKKVDILIAK